MNDAALYTPLLILSVVGDVTTTVGGNGNSTTGLRSVAIADQMDRDAANHASRAGVGGVVFPFRFEQTVTQLGSATPPRTWTRGAPGYQ